jgi:hypothetical protein
VALAIVTPLLEKNVLKTIPLDIPVIFSMSRVILLAFACAMLRQICRAGIAGWPEASLSIAIVLALPVFGALDKVKPADTLELAKVLLSRFGEGGVRRSASVYASSVEPSKYDDHRSDSSGVE